jgi:hypothetical protein
MALNRHHSTTMKFAVTVAVVVVVSMLVLVTVAVIVERTKVMVWGATGSIEPRPHDDCAEAPKSKLARATTETKSNILTIAVDLSEMRGVRIEVGWNCLLLLLPRARASAMRQKNVNGPRNKIPQENDKKLYRDPD